MLNYLWPAYGQNWQPVAWPEQLDLLKFFQTGWAFQTPKYIKDVWSGNILTDTIDHLTFCFCFYFQVMLQCIPSLLLTSYILGESTSAWEKKELSPDWYMKDTKYPFRKHIFFWHLVQEKPNKTNKTPQRQEYKLTSVKASKEDANPYSKFRKRIKKESIV